MTGTIEPAPAAKLRTISETTTTPTTTTKVCHNQ